MPHAFRTYKQFQTLGFTEAQSSAFAGVVERAKANHERFNKERVGDALFDGGFNDHQSEALSAVLQHCFYSEIFSTHLDERILKFNLVRSGISAVLADGILAAIKPATVTRRDNYPRVPIRFAPSAGRVVMCDFTHLIKPEMVKERRAVVIAKGASEQCAVVIPVSMKETNNGHPFYHRMEAGSYQFFHQLNPVWALCDHVYTVSLSRTWQVVTRNRPSIPSLRPDDLAAIRRLLGTSLGLSC
jgi:uncharacterized protein YifN (PemK superfamily)